MKCTICVPKRKHGVNLVVSVNVMDFVVCSAITSVKVRIKIWRCETVVKSSVKSLQILLVICLYSDFTELLVPDLNSILADLVEVEVLDLGLVVNCAIDVNGGNGNFNHHLRHIVVEIEHGLAIGAF